MAIDPKTALQAAPEDQITAWVPQPLNARLDALVALARVAGENTNRKELLAAFLLDAPEDPQALTEALRRYRTATADAAVIEGHAPGPFLSRVRRKPGPRPRRSS